MALAPFDNVDAEPLMAELLGLKGSKGDGTADNFRKVLPLTLSEQRIRA